jgi:hypothetical protein
MSGNLQEVSLGGAASALALASSETNVGEGTGACTSRPASDCVTRLLPSQPQASSASTPSQLDKGEESPLLTHCTATSSQSALPDLLEALQKETEAASQQKLQQYQQQQASENAPEDDWSADHYSSDDEYHSPLEDQDETEEFKRSAVRMNVNVNTSINMRQSRSRAPAEQVEHPLRLTSYNSNKELVDPSLTHANDSFLGFDHPLRNTPMTPSPPTSIRSNPTLDGSTSSNTTCSTLEQHPSTAATSAATPDMNANIAQNHHRRRQRHRSSSTSTSSSTTLRRTRAGSSSNNRLAQQQELEQQQQQQHSSQHEGPQDLHGQESLGLRASLDSGMAAIRRWIRTRSSSSSSNHLIQQQQQQQSRSSNRSVSWQSDMDLLSMANEGTSVSASARSLGDDDLFALVMNGDDPRSQQLYHPTIFEEDEDEEDVGRQRSLSEPDALSFRNYLFQQALGVQSRSMRRRYRRRGRAESEGTREVSSSSSHGRAPHLSSSAAAALYSPTVARLPEEPVEFMSLRSTVSVPVASARESSTADGAGGGTGGVGVEMITVPESSMPGTADPTRANAAPESADADSEIDPERQARIRWLRINRRFQLVITIVALLFSLLLFAILICWVVLTSAYVLAFDKGCDVPLKPYYWLVTLQLVLDVFRSDIMRFIFHWDPTSNERIPCRVIAYNMAYLLYALLVLRLGIRSVFLENDTTCQESATELFNTSAVFVSLSLAAWTTILCGYLLPFCVVAALLTYNGYNPSAHINQDDVGGSQAVFPAAYSTTGAPPGCVDQLRLLPMEDFPDDYPRECCICMEDFKEQQVIVETACRHVFHKQCCREWLRTARTCPVCRTDIPATLEDLSEETSHPPRIPLGPTGRPVVGLLRILRREGSNRDSSSSVSNNSSQRTADSPSAVSVHPNVP